MYIYKQLDNASWESFTLLLIASVAQSRATQPLCWAVFCLPPSPSTFPLVVHNLFWKFPCTSEIDVNLGCPVEELRMGVEWKLVLFTRITENGVAKAKPILSSGCEQTLCWLLGCLPQSTPGE